MATIKGKLKTKSGDVMYPETSADKVVGLSDAYVTTDTQQTITGQKNFESAPKVKIGHETLVPSGYKEVEYIESSGTQYIDTGYTTVTNRKFEIDAKQNEILSGFPTILGAMSGASTYKVVFGYGSSGGKFYTQCGKDSSGYGYIVSGIPQDTARHKAVVRNTASGQTLTVDGDVADGTYNIVTDADTGLNLFLFARNKGSTVSNYSSARLYGYKYSDLNGNVIQHLVPCYRENDGEVGLYDVTNGRFLTNSGTGEFAKGPDIQPTSYFDVLTEADVSSVAISGSYADLSDKPSNLVTTDGVQNINGNKTFIGQTLRAKATENASNYFYVKPDSNGNNAKIGFQSDNLMLSNSYVYSMKHLIPNGSSVDLGISANKWRDLYLSGSLKDGTNSIAVADIASKTDVQNVAELAEGKTSTYIIDDADDITGTAGLDGGYTNVTAIAGVTISDLKLGDIVLIKETDVPDFWVSQLNETSEVVTSVSLSKMETAKVNLGEYVSRAGSENVTGVHDFANGLQVGGITVEKDSSDRIIFNFSSTPKVKIGQLDTLFANRITADSSNTYDIGRKTVNWRDLYISGAIKDSASDYGAVVPSTSGWTANRTISLLESDQTFSGANTFNGNVDVGTYTGPYPTVTFKGANSGRSVAFQAENYKFKIMANTSSNVIGWIDTSKDGGTDNYTYNLQYVHPKTNDRYDLGTSSLKWKNLYLSGNLSDGTNSVTVADIVGKADASDVPTNVSQLTNDAGYITSAALPTNHVTTDTQQTITAKKQFTVRPTLKTAGLPNSYQEIEYAESNGTPYVNTGLPVHMGWKYKIVFRQNTAATFRIWGVFNQSAYNAGLNCSLTYGSNTWLLRWEKTSGGTSSISLPVIDTLKHTLYVDDGEAFFDGVDSGKTSAHDSSVVSSYNAFLFTINPGGNTPTATMNGRIYLYQVWNGEGVLQQEYIPCKRKSDGVVGFYDTVSSAFVSATNGALTSGPEVVDSDFLVQNDLAAVALSGDYNDLSNKPANLVTTNTAQTIDGQKTVTAPILVQANVGMHIYGANNNTNRQVSFYSDHINILDNSAYQSINVDYKDIATMSDIPSVSLTTTAGSESITVGSDSLNVATRDTAQTISAKKTFSVRPSLVASPLPNAYQRVQYLQSSGTQYIDTGFKASASSGIKLTYAYAESGNAGVSGIFQSTAPRTDTLFVTTNSGQTDSGVSLISKGISWNTGVTPVVGTKYEAQINYRNSGKLVFGEMETADGTNGVVSARNIILFGRDNGGNYALSKTRIYACEITEGSSVVREFVPCYRVSDSVAGLYDVRNGEFYTNAGTGTFSVGANVSSEDFTVSSDFSPVAFSGSYADLSNTPIIPSDIVTQSGVQPISGQKTFNAGPILGNQVSLFTKDSGGTAKDVFHISSANNFIYNSDHTGNNYFGGGGVMPMSAKSGLSDLGDSSHKWKDLYLSNGLRDGKNANYSLKLPDSTSWTANKTIATTAYVDSAIETLSGPMVFKGTLGGAGATIASLPTASASNKGHTYKVTKSGTYYPNGAAGAGQPSDFGDMYISNGTEWVYIPSGNDIEDTWRTVKANGSELLDNTLESGYVNFTNASGSHISVSGSGHDVVIGVADDYSIPSDEKQTAWDAKYDLPQNGIPDNQLASTFVKSVNGSSPDASGNVQIDIPSVSLTTTTGSEAVTVGASSLSVATRNTAQTISGTKTFSAGPVLNNNVYLQFKNKAGTAKDVLGINSSNAILLGSADYDTAYRGSSKFYPWVGDTKDLGASDKKWKDLYLSGNLINGANSISVAQIGKVKSVNGEAPDSNGNVSISLPSPITIDTTAKTISDGTNTLSFGDNAFNSTQIPTTYVSTVNGSSGAITNVAKTNVANTFTADQTFTTGKLYINNGNPAGCVVIGGNVSSTGLTANTRKLGRLGIPVYSSSDNTTLNMAAISFDTQVATNFADFGGHPKNTASTSPDIFRFVVSSTHNTLDTTKKKVAMVINGAASGMSDSASGTLGNYNAISMYMPLVSDSNITTSGKFIKSGGTSSQFLKADGSVDSNSYALASSVPSVGNGTLTIEQNGVSKGTFSANASSDSTISIATPKVLRYV